MLYKINKYLITSKINKYSRSPINKGFAKEKVKRILEYVGLRDKLAKLPQGINTAVYKHFDENGFAVAYDENSYFTYENGSLVAPIA